MAAVAQDIRQRPVQVLTRADKVIKFVHKYIPVPEGMLVGKPMELLPEQIDFVRAVYDNVEPVTQSLITRMGILSMPRKNGKSGLIAALLGAHIIGPEAALNSQLYSAARSREQASIVFKYLAKSLRMRTDLEGLVRITDSGKRIFGLAKGTEYHALSADAQTAHGTSPKLTIHDELGQVVGPTDALFDALETGGGAHEDPLSLVISTQAASDTDLLSLLIDDAIRNPTPENVVRLYATDKDADIWDEANWYKSNFALGIYRSLKDMRNVASKAQRMPTQESSFRNLYLNQRISRLTLLVPPTLWRDCNSVPNLELFYKYPVSLGFDLSGSTDLTACVASVQDPADGKIHCLPFVFTPLDTMLERSKSDRAPYPTWVANDQLIALPGKFVNYGMVAEYLKKALEGMQIDVVAFDRWRINDFKQACERANFLQAKDISWQPCGQGFRDMTLRVEEFEKLLLGSALLHGGHPLLNLGAAHCVVATDPANNKKPVKNLSSQRIDPLVAMLMSVYARLYPNPEDKPKPVSEKSLFFV